MTEETSNNISHIVHRVGDASDDVGPASSINPSSCAPNSEQTRYVIKKLRSASEVPECLGEIIVQTAPEVYSFIYGDDPAKALTTMTRESGNCFSWENLWLAYEVNHEGELGEVVGALVAYEPRELDMSGWFPTLVRRYGFGYALRCFVRYNVLYALAGHDTHLPFEQCIERSFHLQELAVVERVRGRGIATRLINALEIHAQRCCSAKGLRYCLSLQVEEDNENARRLYEHLGFQSADREPHYYTCPCLYGAARWSRMVKDCSQPPRPDPDYFY